MIIIKKFEFDHTNIVYEQTRICPRNWDEQNSWGCQDTNEPPNHSQMTRPIDRQQKKRTCQTMDFAVPDDHWIKLKESKKRDKYLNLAGELKKNYGIWK